MQPNSVGGGKKVLGVGGHRSFAEDTSLKEINDNFKGMNSFPVRSLQAYQRIIVENSQIMIIVRVQTNKTI